MNDQIIISSKSYEVNGVTYDSIEDMPEEARKVFDDKNNDGTPDILENLGEEFNDTSIEINGVKYDSWDQVPPEYQKYRNVHKSIHPKFNFGISGKIILIIFLLMFAFIADIALFIFVST